VSGTKNAGKWVFAALLAPLLLIGALLGAMSNADTATERIPVALVNNDEIIIEEDENGEETFFLASRPLVLELVGGDDISLDWVITDSERAAEMLESGEVYAVFEIPATFSQSVKTLDSTSPEPATFIIRTNPARSYLAGIVAEQIGVQVASALNQEFGKEILDGLFTVIVDLGDAFIEAADASREISDGVSELSDGVGELRNGTRELANGYAEFDDGLGQYLDGVGQLADGLATFERETRELPDLARGVGQYTDGVTQISGSLSDLVGNASAFFSSPAVTYATPEAEATAAQILAGLQALSGGLGTAAQSGPALKSGVNDAVGGIREGLVDSRDGARELANASGELRDGSGEILSGVRELNSGVRELDEGVTELAEGVLEFADALTEGAEEIAEELPGDVSDETLETLVSPVTSTIDSGRLSAGVNDNLSAVIIPLGLWLSSLLAIVVLPGLGRRPMSSTVSSSRLLMRSLGSALVMAAGQAGVALALIHTLGGVSWSALGWTAPLVFVGTLAFIAVHFMVWAGSPKAVVPLSLAALVAQIATFGVVLPAEILPAAYQAVAGWGPVSWLSDALLGAAAGDATARMMAPLVGLSVLAVVAVFISRWLFGRRRHALVRDYYLTGASL
jgi:putative membrane protein